MRKNSITTKALLSRTRTQKVKADSTNEMLTGDPNIFGDISLADNGMFDDDDDDDDEDEEVSILEAMGDLIFGDHQVVSDFGKAKGSGDIHLGDLTTGNPRDALKKLRNAGKFAKATFKRATSDQPLPSPASPANGAPVLGQYLPGMPSPKADTVKDVLAARVIAGIPGVAVSNKMFSPLIINNGLFSRTPTRSLVSGVSFMNTVNRFETQYPGSTRVQVFPAAAGTQVATFAAPALAEGGNVLFTPVIFVQLGIQRNSSVAGAEVGFAITSGIAESGNAVSAAQWNVIMPDSLDSVFVALIPYVEIASQIFPAIINASVANPLVLTVTGLPTNTNVRVTIPGPDSAQYQSFKVGFGLGAPTDGLVRNV